MARYTVTNELTSLEFETSWLENVTMTDTELTLTFREAIVVGNRDYPQICVNLQCGV